MYYTTELNITQQARKEKCMLRVLQLFMAMKSSVLWSLTFMYWNFLCIVSYKNCSSKIII